MESTFNIWNVVQLLGGLAFFLFAMTIMSSGLERMAGGKLEKLLRKVTSNKWKGMAVGLLITGVVQSSSSVTVMLVGLVNSGIMQLEQSIPIIMGSNIGTCVTAWLMSLTGISSDNIYMQILDAQNLAAIFALIGVIFVMFSKKNKRKDIGTIMVSFGLLLYGMVMMSSAMDPLSEMPSFTNLLTKFNNPVLGVLFGAVFTAIIQSSSASVGILQAISSTGALTYGMVVPIIMGQNIGTCITAVLASIGSQKNAKRVAAVHVCFNMIGTLVFLPLWLLVNSIFDLAIVDQTVSPASIAIIHSLFNLASTFMLIGFDKQLAKLSKLIIRDGSKEDVVLDENLIAIPSVAVNKAELLSNTMGNIAVDAVAESIELLKKYDDSKLENVEALEQQLDRLEDELGTYLIKVSKAETSDKDVRKITRMMHCITDFERIGDHAINLSELAREKSDKEIAFSHNIEEELTVLYEATMDILKRTMKAYSERDMELATSVEPLESVIDRLSRKIKNRQIDQLQTGTATAEIGFVLTDLLTNMERIGDHCSNVAVALVESEHYEYDLHEYLKDLKDGDNTEFKKEYEEFKAMYSI